MEPPPPTLQEKYDLLYSQHSKLQSEHRTLHSEHRTLYAEHRKLDKSHYELCQENDALQSTIHRLKSDIAIKEWQHQDTIVQAQAALMNANAEDARYKELKKAKDEVEVEMLREREGKNKVVAENVDLKERLERESGVVEKLEAELFQAKLELAICAEERIELQQKLGAASEGKTVVEGTGITEAKPIPVALPGVECLEDVVGSEADEEDLPPLVMRRSGRRCFDSWAVNDTSSDTKGLNASTDRNGIGRSTHGAGGESVVDLPEKLGGVSLNGQSRASSFNGRSRASQISDANIGAEIDEPQDITATASSESNESLPDLTPPVGAFESRIPARAGPGRERAELPTPPPEEPIIGIKKKKPYGHFEFPKPGEPVPGCPSCARNGGYVSGCFQCKILRKRGAQ